MKILSIIGARPQFIKEAIVQRELRENNIEEILVHTGQHYDKNMSDVFFEVLDMKIPEYNLGIQGSTHGSMTGQMIIKLEEIMIKEKPDIVLLYGDTNSTLAGAIVASKLKIHIAHVEAGLRQLPKYMPEEINRVLTDRISDSLFCPSQLAVDNLKEEMIRGEQVILSGDVMYDLFLLMKNKFDYSLLKSLRLKENEYIMMTLHRDFNVDYIEVLEPILKQVNELSRQIKVVLPIHPRTKKRIKQFNLEKYLSNLLIIEPIDYLKLMGLTEKCFKVITDSGGYQKEAYFSKKQAYVLMPDTSWRELTENKWNILCESNNLFENILSYEHKIYTEGIYGYGDASKKIVKCLINMS